MPCVTVSFEPSVGPIVILGVAVPGALQAGLGVDPRPPMRGFGALVDTGASITCISPRIVQELGLVPTGKTTMASASATCDVNTYLVDIALPLSRSVQGAVSVAMESVTVMEFHAPNPHFQALLGRDVLGDALLVMSGPEKQVTICM